MGIRLTQSDIQDIRIHYPDGPDHWSVHELSEWIGCSWKTILCHARKLGLPPNRSRRKSRTYQEKLALIREYQRTHREAISRTNKAWYARHREQVLARQKERYHSDPEYRRKQIRRGCIRYRNLKEGNG